MRIRLASRYFLRALIAAGLLAASLGGCSQQGEGERCDFYNAGHEDCDDGLVCITCASLAENVVDRCCPPDGQPFSDPRCARGVHAECRGADGSGGTAGTSSTTGGTGGSDASTGGTEASTGGTDTGTGGTTDTAGQPGESTAGTGG